MLIDSKREKMFHSCRERKKKLDFKMNFFKNILIVPSALLLLSVIFNILTNLLSDSTFMLTGAFLYGAKLYGAPISALIAFLGYFGYLLFGIFYAILKNDFVKRRFIGLHAAGIALSLPLIAAGLTMGFIFIILSAVDILCCFVLDRLHKQDEQMSLLEGYPHFNPLLMTDREEPFVPKASDELSEMTPEERIMYEREN